MEAHRRCDHRHGIDPEPNDAASRDKYMKHTNNKSFLIPFAAAVLFLGACGSAESDSSELPVNDGAEPAAEQPLSEPGDSSEPTGAADLVVSSDDGSELPVNTGAEPATEQPILEPGDELGYNTDPIDLADA
jgi:hypothetical protein